MSGRYLCALNPGRVAQAHLTESSEAMPQYSFAFGGIRALDIARMLADAGTKTFLIDPVDAAGGRAAQSERVRLTTIEQFLARRVAIPTVGGAFKPYTVWATPNSARVQRKTCGRYTTR